MNLFVTISITLLVILAALFYLLKVKNENHGAAFRIPGLLVLAAACSLLLLLTFKGVKRLIRHDRRDDREMKFHGNGNNMRMGKEEMNCMHSHGDKMKCCCMDDGDDCCMEKEHDRMSDDMHSKTEISTDTTDGKVIKKEIRIIKK